MAVIKKDEILLVVAENIPSELKAYKQFILWKAQWNEDRRQYEKIPYQLNGKDKASVIEPSTWSTLDAVIDAYENGVGDGIGFVLTEDDPFSCLDLDDLEDVDDLPALAQEVVNMSYAETSPSGKGIHVWFRYEHNKERHKNKNAETGYEIYSNSRYLTITGENLNDLPINEGGVALDDFLDKVLKREEVKVSITQQNENIGKATLSEEEIIKIACNNPITGERFKSFLHGGWEPNYNSDYSSGDLAFLNYLAFWGNCDYQMMDSIYRKSSLMRDKWDRPQNGTTYGNEQIMKAINECTNTFNPTKKTDSNINGLELSDRGTVIPNARNAEKILTNSPFKGVLAYDIFKGSEVIKGDLPWRKRENPDADFELWLGSDDKRLLHHFGVLYDFNSAKIIENAYLDVVRRNAFHPVKDYLEAQSWDGVPRAETLFIDYLGAEDTPYIRAVTRKWLAAAVSRIYEPGCKFDYMPVLVGPQGVGKSTIIAKLARDWFSDSLKNLDGKEASEHLQSSWIFEMGELAAMKKGEVEEIKAFITKQIDSYRVAYERVVSEFPRKCVFIGTTNRNDFLRDQTGNRRFWAITTNPLNRKYEINDFTDEVVGQVWAEVMILYKQGEKLYLDSKLEEEARLIQESHMESDPRIGLIEEYLDRLLPFNWNSMKIYERINFLASERTGEVKRERVCAAEIWSECLGNDYNNFKPFEAAAIYDILRKVEGWEERKPNRTTFKHYGKQTTFIRST